MDDFVVIHRSCDTEREPLISRLQEAFPLLRVSEAADGEMFQTHPRRHPWEDTPTSSGNIGNTVSHMDLVLAAQNGTTDRLFVFEDDAVVVGEISGVLERIPEPWDLFYWGTNEIVEGTEEGEFVRVKRAWGVHAIVLRRSAMKAVLLAYIDSVAEGYGYPADWVYNRAIKEGSLIAYASKTNLIVQQPGLVSVNTGKLRSQQNEVPQAGEV